MKNDVLLICLAFALASCQSIPVLQPTSTPIPPTPTNTSTPTFTPIPLTPTSTSAPSPSPELTLSPDKNEKNDYLVYIANEWNPSISSKPQLTLYDPANNATRVLLTNFLFTNWGNNSFSLSKDNRLAYLKDDNIYIWDYPFIEDTQTEVVFGGSPTTEKGVLSWSPDGRYLLLKGAQENRKKLFLWDEKNILDIYNYQGEIADTTWSNNGKLALTELPINNAPGGFFGKIIVWDGKDIINVSQNPSTSPTWSKEGQLAFLSYQNREYTISVWDGKSKNNGAPDIKTPSAPDLELSINSQPTLTNSGTIAFTGCSKTNRTCQIYEWDGQTTRTISQSPLILLGWRNDGYWSALVDDGFTIIIRDNINRTVLETKGAYSQWTQSGLLVFCNYKNKHTLSIWNGKNIVDIAHGDSVFAEWTNSNGKSILCTYG